VLAVGLGVSTAFSGMGACLADSSSLHICSSRQNVHRPSRPKDTEVQVDEQRETSLYSSKCLVDIDKQRKLEQETRCYRVDGQLESDCKALHAVAG